MATTPVMSENAQLIDGAATVLMFAAFAYIPWGLISPRSAMFWAKRRNRLWSTGLGVCFVFLAASIGVYAQSGQPAGMLTCGALAIWMIAWTGRAPKTAPRAVAASSWAGPTPAPSSQAASDAAVAAIRASVPEVQQGEFDACYGLRKHSWSLLGRDQVAAKNLGLAQDCVRQAARIWELKHGALPSVEAALPLGAGESCVWKGDCERLAYVTVHSTEYRHSGDTQSEWNRNVRVEDTTHDELQRVDAGKLYLTTKRLLFVGQKKNVFLDVADIQTLVVNNAVDITIGRSDAENLIFRSQAARDPFDPRLTGPFEILWDRVRSAGAAG